MTTWSTPEPADVTALPDYAYSYHMTITWPWVEDPHFYQFGAGVSFHLQADGDPPAGYVEERIAQLKALFEDLDDVEVRVLRSTEAYQEML